LKAIKVKSLWATGQLFNWDRCSEKNQDIFSGDNCPYKVADDSSIREGSALSVWR